MSQCPSHNCYGPRGALGSQLGGQRGPSSPPPSLITDGGLCPAPTTALLGACAPITNGQHHQEPRSSLSDFRPTGPRRQDRGRTAKRRWAQRTLPLGVRGRGRGNGQSELLCHLGPWQMAAVGTVV